jgi:multiple sugar transport system ATP-binding protein
MASITLENIHKRYPGDVHVLKGIDLEIPDKGFVTLVGPSGCGKSTTLNIIAGLEGITEGVLRFDEDVVNDWSPRRRDIAMVFQSYALYPHKSVYENIAFPLRINKLDGAEIDRRVREAARKLEIEPLLDRKPRDLSGGQRQRVALGRALVRNARAFLFDEPLSNLDAALRVQMRAEIKRLHEELLTTFVYVTHDQAEAMTLSDTVVVFLAGTIQQAAPPQQIYDRPENVFVARFVGSPQINVLSARIEDGVLASPAGRHALPARAPASGREVLAGVRPENAHVALGDGADGLRGEVFVVEPTGPENWVVVDLAGRQRITCRAAPTFEAPPGAPVRVWFDAERLHFFDPSTQQRIVVD